MFGTPQWLCVGIPAVALACSAVGAPDDSVVGGAGGSSASQGGTGGDGGDAVFAGGAGGGGPCTAHCSTDLHDVVDCSGDVLLTCPPDQGCSKNGCVPACESAAENQSTTGCDYFSIYPDIRNDYRGGCFAAFVANTWNAPLTIGLEYDGASLDIGASARIPSGTGTSIDYAPLPNGELPPGQVAIVFLSAKPGGFSIACPDGVEPAVQDVTSVAGTGLGSAFHLTTSVPAVAYDIAPYGGGNSGITSATLLLPTTAWDTNYVAVNAFRKTQIVAEEAPSMAIVAAEDDTEVTINPTAAILAGAGVDGTAAGVPHTYGLSKGQVLQFTQDAELTGSIVQSTKPVGVWGGATCMTIDVDDFACDMAHQQLAPVRMLGSEYAAVRYRNRIDGPEESVPWRFVGAVDGTALTYQPAPPAGAPASIDAGEVLEVWTSDAFVVSSQDADHPFYVSGHMTGSTVIQDSNTGDPEFVNVVPTAQYLKRYVFFTDPTYPETDLVVVRAKQGGTFRDVVLDCAGVLGGWQDLGEHQYTRVPISRDNYEKQGACDNGRHEMTSDAPFGVTVWGWSNHFNGAAQSYAYPAGAGVRPINRVVIDTSPK